MAKPLYHAISSVKIFGGKYQDYIQIHNLMDSTKSSHPRMAHRSIFHNDYGHKLVIRILGESIVNSDGNQVSVLKVAEHHTQEDLNFIPTLADYSKEYKPDHGVAHRAVGPSAPYTVEWHSKRSAKHYGGKPSDYSSVHELMLEPAATAAGRAIFHNCFGTFIVEQILGIALTNSDGKIISIRDVAEQHILNLFKRIPTLDEWLEPINQPWMAGSRKAQIIIID